MKIDGAWVVTTRDYYESVDSVHETELDALRLVNEQGYGKVRFLRWGLTLHEMDQFVEDRSN